MPASRAWRLGALWTLPFALWLLAFVGTGAGFVGEAVVWRSQHNGWKKSVAAWREQNHVAPADAASQMQTLREIDRTHLNRLVALGFGFAFSAAAARLYRTKVPAAWRGGTRALVLGGLLAGVCVTAAYFALTLALRGMITD